jgi:hypothetical protein
MELAVAFPDDGIPVRTASAGGGPTPANGAVRPSDVLLFAGQSRLAWATRRLDGAEVDHAAIALGDDRVSEVTSRGVVVTSLPAMVERHQTALVCRPASAVDAQIALGAVQQFLARPVWYAYQPVVLLALLCLTKPLAWQNPAVRRLVRTVLDHASGLLQNLAERGRTHLFCSDYVARCHPELTPRPPAAVAAPEAGVYVDLVRDMPDQAKGPPGWLARRLGRQPRLTTAVAEADLAPLVLAFAADQSGGKSVDLEPLGTGPEPLGTPSRIPSADLVAAGVTFRDLLLATSAMPIERTADAWDDLDRFAAATVTPAGLLGSPDLTVVEELRA